MESDVIWTESLNEEVRMIVSYESAIAANVSEIRIFRTHLSTLTITVINFHCLF